MLCCVVIRGCSVCKPFLRWAGGKRRLAPVIVERILPLLGEGGQYFEPFLGSGAVFFELRKQGWEGHALLSEFNEDLIWLYRCVQDPVCLKALTGQLLVWHSDPFTYLLVREFLPHNGLGAAARVYYLNRCGFNGLWRVNKDGRYNVPYGRPECDDRPVCDEATLLAASKALHLAELEYCDLEQAIARARKGDVVYCDPPYPGGFTAYTPGWLRRRGSSSARACALYRGSLQRCSCCAINQRLRVC